MFYALRALQAALERALALETGLQLAEGVHLGRFPQVMQVSTSAPFHSDSLKGCVHQVHVRDSHARSNACSKCGELGHFQKDCKATLNPQGDDRDDAALSDTNPTISQMIHTLTASTPITYLAFMAILKELISSAIGNRRAFCSKPQTIPKTIIYPSAGGVNLTVTSMVTTMASTSLQPNMSSPTQSATSSGNTSHPVNPNRGPPQTKHQAAVSQGARVKANRPVTSQAVVQLLDVLDEITERIQCEESAEETNSVEEVHDIAKQFQESPHDC